MSSAPSSPTLRGPVRTASASGTRNSRPAPRGSERPWDRPAARQVAVDDFAGAAPQRPRRRRLPALRRAPQGRCPAGSPPPAASGDKRRAAAAGRRAAGPAVEPAADCPPPAGSLPARPRHAAVPREHLPGALPARISARAPGEGAVCAPLTAAHRAGSPAGPTEGCAAPAPVRPADVLHPPPTLRSQRPWRTGALGGRPCDAKKSHV
jgi:hypothetical protein